MLRLPDNPDLRELLDWAHDRNLFTLAICHAAAALLATDTSSRLIYQRYQIFCFPSRNQQTPMVGYMPRPMPRYFVEKLNVFGRTHLSTQSPMQPTVLTVGFSQAPVRKQQLNFADWPKTPLLTRLARNNRDCKNVENLPISPLIC